MATLKANGPELLRISRERHIDTPTSPTAYRGNASPASITRMVPCSRRPTSSFARCSSGINPKGTRHTWGWKKVVLSEAQPTPVRRANDVLAAIKAGTTGSAQWTVEFESASLNPVEVKS